MVTLLATKPKKVKPRKPRILVLGEAGVGKTWAALEWDRPYYIDCEGGATQPHYQDRLSEVGAAYLGVDEGASDFETVLGQIQALSSTRHEYNTLIIDSYTKLFNQCVAAEGHRMERSGEKIAFGNDKKKAVKLSRQMVTHFETLDMNVLLICHQKPKWENDKQVGYTFDGWDKIEYELDLSLHITKQGKARKAKVHKSRLEKFPPGAVVDWHFATFADALGADLLTADSAPIELATPEQVHEAHLLANDIKLAPDRLASWWEAAGVETWAEMERGKIQKCIDLMQSELEGVG